MIGPSSARSVGVGLLLAIMSASCAGGAAPIAKVSPSASLDELGAIRARGSLIVGIRVEQPPAGRNQGDPAHSQKRALEVEVATQVAREVFGPSTKIELRSSGGDRLVPLESGDVDIVMTADTPAAQGRVTLSVPYAAGAVVLATKIGSPIRRVEDLQGQNVVVAQDELGAGDTAQRFLQDRGIKANVQTVTGVNAAVAAIDAGTAQALIGDRTGIAILTREKPGSLTIVAELGKRSFVIATRKDSPELAGAINDALRKLLAPGAIRDAAVKAGFPYEVP
jgi:ABC-type amino acid transport substrate-binding protein